MIGIGQIVSGIAERTMEMEVAMVRFKIEYANLEPHANLESRRLTFVDKDVHNAFRGYLLAKGLLI